MGPKVKLMNLEIRTEQRMQSKYNDTILRPKVSQKRYPPYARVMGYPKPFRDFFTNILDSFHTAIIKKEEPLSNNFAADPLN